MSPGELGIPFWVRQFRFKFISLLGYPALECSKRQMLNIYQAGLVIVPAGYFTFSSGAAQRQSRNRFSPTLRGVFARPGLVMPSSPLQTQYLQRQWTPPTRIDLLQADTRARGEPCGGVHCCPAVQGDPHLVLALCCTVPVYKPRCI